MRHQVSVEARKLWTQAPPPLNPWLARADTEPHVTQLNFQCGLTTAASGSFLFIILRAWAR